MLEIILAAPNGHEVENTSFYSLSYLLAREQTKQPEFYYEPEPDKPLNLEKKVSLFITITRCCQNFQAEDYTEEQHATSVSWDTCNNSACTLCGYLRSRNLADISKEDDECIRSCS